MPDSHLGKQSTLDSSISWEGIGLHSGLPCKVTAHPADPDTGIKFKRIDLDDEQLLPANIRYVSSTERSTNLSNGTISIGTVEHIMAALFGADITNVQIHVDGPEIPILDGSAAEFYQKLREHRVGQDASDKKVWLLDNVVEFTDEVSGASYTLVPSDQLEIEVIIDYNRSDIGRQYATYSGSDDFVSLADARTFVLTSELEELCKKGLIRGGDLTNAVVISSGSNGNAEFRNAMQLLGKAQNEATLKTFERGFELKYQDELARHKILDLLGDLSLLGTALKAKIIAKKPGHTGNAALVNHLRPLMQKAVKLKGKPKYDPNVAPIFNTVDIQGFLPHRYPFLLVDKIIELSDTHVVGIKNITFNEQLFQGHFPGNPIFPGVLQMEALAQTGGILALNGKENSSDWDTYFLKMDKVKFKNMVVPGDTLILKMELVSPIRRGLVHMQGTAYVGDKIASEGELIAHIVDRTKNK